MSRPRAEKSLAESARESYLREIVLESTSDGIVVADDTGRFVIWNAAATELVGLGSADIGPEKWSKYYRIYDPETEALLPTEKLPLVRAIHGETVDDQDIVIHNAESGHKVWLSCNAKPIRDEAGGIVGGVIVFRDVTERRRVERELEWFARSVGHDLKAPLTGILGLSEALQEAYGDILGEEGRELIESIHLAAERMQALIDDLLRHAKIGQDWEGWAEVSLRSVVDRALLNLDAEIRRADAQIDVRGEFPVVRGHAAGLEQVFQNLIGNAIKFVERGERPKVEIGCVDEPHAWNLYVRDQGVGIEPKYSREIFDVFRRLYGRDRYEGTGIGLAIVKKIVELHRGEISVESEPGKGSTFWVRLPKKFDSR